MREISSVRKGDSMYGNKRTNPITNREMCDILGDASTYKYNKNALNAFKEKVEKSGILKYYTDFVKKNGVVSAWMFEDALMDSGSRSPFTKEQFKELKMYTQAYADVYKKKFSNSYSKKEYQFKKESFHNSNSEQRQYSQEKQQTNPKSYDSKNFLENFFELDKLLKENYKQEESYTNLLNENRKKAYEGNNYSYYNYFFLLLKNNPNDFENIYNNYIKLELEELKQQVDLPTFINNFCKEITEYVTKKSDIILNKLSSENITLSDFREQKYQLKQLENLFESSKKFTEEVKSEFLYEYDLPAFFEDSTKIEKIKNVVNNFEINYDSLSDAERKDIQYSLENSIEYFLSKGSQDMIGRYDWYAELVENRVDIFRYLMDDEIPGKRKKEFFQNWKLEFDKLSKDKKEEYIDGVLTRNHTGNNADKMNSTFNTFKFADALDIKQENESFNSLDENNNIQVITTNRNMANTLYQLLVGNTSGNGIVGPDDSHSFYAVNKKRIENTENLLYLSKFIEGLQNVKDPDTGKQFDFSIINRFLSDPTAVDKDNPTAAGVTPNNDITAEEYFKFLKILNPIKVSDNNDKEEIFEIGNTGIQIKCNLQSLLSPLFSGDLDNTAVVDTDILNGSFAFQNNGFNYNYDFNDVANLNTDINSNILHQNVNNLFNAIKNNRIQVKSTEKSKVINNGNFNNNNNIFYPNSDLIDKNNITIGIGQNDNQRKKLDELFNNMNDVMSEATKQYINEDGKMVGNSGNLMNGLNYDDFSKKIFSKDALDKNNPTMTIDNNNISIFLNKYFHRVLNCGKANRTNIDSVSNTSINNPIQNLKKNIKKGYVFSHELNLGKFYNSIFKNNNFDIKKNMSNIGNIDEAIKGMEECKKDLEKLKNNKSLVLLSAMEKMMNGNTNFMKKEGSGRNANAGALVNQLEYDKNNPNVNEIILPITSLATRDNIMSPDDKGKKNVKILSDVMGEHKKCLFRNIVKNVKTNNPSLFSSEKINENGNYSKSFVEQEEKRRKERQDIDLSLHI